MIFDQIVIENFGVYAGRQQAELTPAPGRPIILFGGMNGGGKTTLLDAIQLALYGSRARTSNRGRMAYRDYLRACIHRGADPGDGAMLQLRWRRFHDGEPHNYELTRSWRVGVRGLEEDLRILKDGLPDQVITEHWAETLAAYLPERLAHLFFFDGEQIKDLAEGANAAQIVGTAIDGLLGIDLITRLGGDLKVFERGVRERQREHDADDAAARALRQAHGELQQIEHELEAIAIASGAEVNASNALVERLRHAEKVFEAAGGELYARRAELERQRAELVQQKEAIETELRGLIAGPLPLGLVDDLLMDVAQQAKREIDARQARLTAQTLEERDAWILERLTGLDADAGLVHGITKQLNEDRRARAALANEPLLLNADDHLAAEIAHLRETLIPQSRDQARALREQLRAADAALQHLDQQIERVPSAEHIAAAQETLEQARSAHAAKQADIEQLRQRRDLLDRQKHQVMGRIDRLEHADLDGTLSRDHRGRLLKHSIKVRDTLAKLRLRVIDRHAERLEALMLDCFQQLLHKPDLARGLRIDPASFQISLTGQDGHVLPFDRLSAGERQLLATAMLWGLARASGRPIPTIIDTPLGRLDSSHRRNLVDHYFPNASHQVILLSTDEELVGAYYNAIAPFVARSYLLTHKASRGNTTIDAGYFRDYEAAS
jgi:DNA sulfur modification protein DndD